MKKCLTLLIATVLSGISLTAYAAQPMSNLVPAVSYGPPVPFRQLAHQT